MTVEEFQKLRHDFSESRFLSSANHMIKRMFNAVTLNQFDQIQHFMSDSVYQKFMDMKSSAEENHTKLVFNQVNVHCVIHDIMVQSEYDEISVRATCKYCKYFTSLDGTIVKGNSTNRIEREYLVVFQKPVNGHRGIVDRCLGCGRSLAVNESGVCPDCGRVYDLELFDYIIKKFD